MLFRSQIIKLSLPFVDQAPQSTLAGRRQRQQRVYNMMKDLQQKHLATIMQGKISEQENTDLSESQSICRICHSSGEEPLITPCYCSGSAKHVHASCLLTWFKKEVKNTCELCRHKVDIKKKGKPYAEVSLFNGFQLTVANLGKIIKSCLHHKRIRSHIFMGCGA